MTTPAEGRLAFARFLMNGEPHELRVLAEDGRYSGVYATPDELAEAAERFDGEGDVYVTANPVSLEPIAARRVGKGESTSMGDVIRRGWFLVDLDAYQDSEEVVRLKEHLEGLGWPMPLVMYSGNGYWLLYRYDGPNTPEETELHRRALVALKGSFPSVDTSVHDPNRIIRFAHTTNLNRRGKGDGKQHLARLITPAEAATDVLPREKLEALAASVDPEAHEAPEHGVPGNREVVASKLAECGITLKKAGRQNKRGVPAGDRWELSDCPFYPDDTHVRSAILIEWDDGNLAFSCRGQRCGKDQDDNRILALLELLDLRTVAQPAGLKLVRFIDIKPERVEFCWDHRLVLYDNNAIVGGEDAGKGCLMCRLAADLSRGRLLGRPVPVLYAALEERLAAIVRPRLELAGADLEMVLTPPMGSLNLPHGIAPLMQSVRELGVEFAFIDVVNKHFADGFDPLKSKDVGVVMGELAKAASENNVTIVSSLHTNRDKSVDAAMRYAHSAEFRRSIRSSIIIGQAKDMEEHERLIVHDKHNYSVKDPSLTASIAGRAIMIDGKSSEYPVLTIGEETDAYDTSEIFLAQVDRDGAIADAKAEVSAKGAVRQYILGKWERLGRPSTIPASEFASLLKEFSEATVRRARSSLKIQTEEVRNPDTNEVERWDWHFPA